MPYFRLWVFGNLPFCGVFVFGFLGIFPFAGFSSLGFWESSLMPYFRLWVFGNLPLCGVFVFGFLGIFPFAGFSSLGFWESSLMPYFRLWVFGNLPLCGVFVFGFLGIFPYAGGSSLGFWQFFVVSQIRGVHFPQRDEAGKVQKEILCCSAVGTPKETKHGPIGMRNGIPFWLVGEFTTHFRTYFTGDGDGHWGYEILTRGQMDNWWRPLGFPLQTLRSASGNARFSGHRFR